MTQNRKIEPPADAETREDRIRAAQAKKLAARLAEDTAAQNRKVEAKRLMKELTEATVAANPEAFLILPIRRCVHQLDGERCEKEALASRKVCAGHYQAPAGDAVLKALRTAWRTYLSQVDGGAEHMAIQRASNYASRNHETQTQEWYAAAINYYMDR